MSVIVARYTCARGEVIDVLVRGRHQGLDAILREYPGIVSRVYNLNIDRFHSIFRVNDYKRVESLLKAFDAGCASSHATVGHSL